MMEAITKTSPPVAISGLALWGISLNEWVLIGTLVYTTLQTFFLLRDKVYRPWKQKKGLEAGGV